MASSVRSKLTPLQTEVLEAFFQRERGFFLTGGAALAGFHLGHRATDDLDLFTSEARAFERGRFVLAELAQELGAALQVRQDAPGFKRLVLTRGVDALVIDLVKDSGAPRSAISSMSCFSNAQDIPSRRCCLRRWPRMADVPRPRLRGCCQSSRSLMESSCRRVCPQLSCGPTSPA